MIDLVTTLTVDSIRDYQVCELFYELRHRQHEHELIQARELFASRYDKTLRKVAAFYFYKRQGGVVPSYAALLKRFEKLWFPKDIDAYDLAVEQHESAHGNLASYSTHATAALLRFHDDFAEFAPGDPVSIDQSFVLTLAPELRLEGHIDLALRKGPEHTVVMWWGRMKRPGLGHFMFDFAALRMAYQRGRGRDWRGIDVNYALYDLANPNGLIKVDPNGDDVAALIYWAKQARDTDTYVPRRGLTSYCRGCVFDKQCAAWRNWPRGETT